MLSGSIRGTMLGVLCWGFAFADPAGAEERLKLHVHVYNLAEISDGELDRALENTSRILAAAGVHVVWEAGDAASAEGHTVDMSAGAGRRMDDRGFLVVRVLRGGPGAASSRTLGFALPLAQTGAHVTLFYDRIAAEAGTVQQDASKILGSAMAHEIGHVLLGSEQHSVHGIMKAAWSRVDYQFLAAGMLRLQPDEVRVAREEVARRAQIIGIGAGD